MSEPQTIGLQFRLDWRASLLALLLLPVLLSLGFWQLERAEEKRELQALFQQRQQQAPVAIEQLDINNDLRYQPVQLKGEFINGQALLLDNRIYHGRFGYEIIIPFKLQQTKQLVLVNRGWLQGDKSRRTIPAIPMVTGVVELVAEVYVPQSKMMQLAIDEAAGWPRVVQSLDMQKLADELDPLLFPYIVRLSEQSPGSFIANWVVVNVQPEKHIGYAVQWFAMSATLLIIMILANTNVWALLKSCRSH